MDKKDMFYSWYDKGWIDYSALNNLCLKNDIVNQRESKEDVFGEELEELFISVVVTTHNRKEKVLRCINSMDEQIYNNYEIIIIDDASSDGTEEYLNHNFQGKKRYYRNETNLGAGASRKRGFLCADGDVVIFCDDDDYYIDTYYFKKLNAQYQRNENIIMTCSNSVAHKLLDDEYNVRMLNFAETISSRDYLNSFNVDYAKPDSSFTMSLKMSALKNVGYEELKLFNDTSLYLFALLSKGEIGVIKDCIGIYEIHENNMSNSVINADFIIENLDSKYDVFVRANRNHLLDKPLKWLYQQTGITIRYYFSGKYNGIQSDMKMFRWVVKNQKGHYKFIQILKICKYIGMRLMKK